MADGAGHSSATAAGGGGRTKFNLKIFSSSGCVLFDGGGWMASTGVELRCSSASTACTRRPRTEGGLMRPGEGMFWHDGRANSDESGGRFCCFGRWRNSGEGAEIEDAVSNLKEL